MTHEHGTVTCKPRGNGSRNVVEQYVFRTIALNNSRLDNGKPQPRFRLIEDSGSSMP